MSKPTLKTWTEKNGAAVAELEIATPGGLAVYRASMRPGEVAEVRRRVERLAAAHNANLRGYMRGTDPDDVLPPSGTSSRTPAPDPDALMEPSLLKSKSKPAPARKPTTRITIGPAVVERGPFKKLVSLGLRPKSSSSGAAASFVPAAGGLHCIRMPDGRIAPTRIFHCKVAGEAAEDAVGPFKYMTYGDVRKVSAAHVRSALVGRIAGKIPARVRGLMAGASEMGVTGFRRPEQEFVDDGYREEQMLRATQAGPNLMDKYLHDGVMGALEEIVEGPQEIDGTFAGEAIEEGVYDGLKPYSRGEIVRPEEVMNPPEDVLEAGTILEEGAAAPKSTFITPHEVNGDDAVEYCEDRRVDPAALVGLSIDKKKLAAAKAAIKANPKMSKAEKQRLLKGAIKTSGGLGIKKLGKSIGSKAKTVGRVTKTTALAKGIGKTGKSLGKNVAKKAVATYDKGKAVAKAAVNLRQYVPGRDAGKEKLAKETYEKSWKKLALGLAHRRGSKQPTVTEVNQAQLQAKALMKKHGLPVDKLGWTAAGLSEIPRAAWEAAGGSLSGNWAPGCLALKRAADRERRQQVTSLRGLHPQTASMLGEDVVVDEAINDDLNVVVGKWMAGTDGSTVLVGAWWNPLSWHKSRSKKVLKEADLLAQSPDDLPELPPGAEGGPPADEAPPESEAPADEPPAEDAPEEGEPSEEVPPEEEAPPEE
jgi:hypothetical protein